MTLVVVGALALLAASAASAWEGATIAVTARGNVVAGGRVRNAGSWHDVAVVELDGRPGTTVSARTRDGTATATKCDLPRYDEPCKGRCRFTRKGIDQDTLTALAIDPFGRVVFTGWLNDRRRGRETGFVMQVSEP